jgi:hypothetical protein
MYSDDAGGVSVLHFGGGQPLCQSPISQPVFVWAVPAIDDEDQEFAAVELCRFVANSGLYIPYGIAFSANAGLGRNIAKPYFIPDGKCVGLTCATFVMWLLLQAGIKLLKTPWPLDKDDLHHFDSWIHNYLQQHRAALVPAFEAQMPTPRYRPEDVLAAGLYDSLPVSFCKCRKAGPIIQTITAEYYQRAHI